MTATTVAPVPVGARNGASSHDEFPVESFKAAAPHLRRPFTPAAVKWKVQATWSGGALIVGYIDARLVVERLNLVCPHLWMDEYQPVDGDRLMCRLTIDGITRHDIGEGYQGKGLWSDAFKRAAVKFGVGVSLYAIPQTFLNEQQGHLKKRKDGYVLTPDGERACRDRYAAWLETVGTSGFGVPLDHGDVEGSQGDAEAPEPAAASPVAPVAQPSLIPAAVATQLYTEADRIGVTDKLQLAATHVHGEDVGACDSREAAIVSLCKLTVDQAERLSAWLLKKAEEAQHA